MELYSKKLGLACITGIGNMEPQYAMTRHNVGICFVDYLKDYLLRGQQPKEFKKCRSAPYVKYLCISNQLVLLRYDGNFMNLSGKYVVPIWSQLPNRHEVRHIVVHDDLSLPVGKVQLRKPESSLRGHNGLKDIAKYYGNRFHKLSVGVDRPESRDSDIVAKYVLNKFNTREVEVLQSESFPSACNLLEKMLLS
ncbi:hypothetical protein KAFR_0L01980 [Kazachstania africana CBS 2517]|uniref:Peptidyl-tRNA hydrolase n=1 Tax=Kazachstania africana (strain ATCC 22294 / BCRC 22015 / CBS 2517 / CECT 1963 / NBRC 1671 / NRRL Y-8276) TaxID=1071382 RepID=H2B2F9_KAZAF|nr:hypothetical protein KAFR_0L01980 [Kazachstania africana CBS 2517]CCF60809.1 hypothetical protein KAFR_0L01980 [Kazachstania africana CBS 2517]